MSFSAEPNRRRPYDRDLRWRIVLQRIGMGLQYDKIAQNLNVSTSTAYRICARFDATGEVQPTLNKHRPYLYTTPGSAKSVVCYGPDHGKSRSVSCRDMPAHT